MIFLVYFTGSLSSSFMGHLLQRFGRTFMLRLSIASMILGTLITLSVSLVWIITGIGLFTCGFFGAHAIASGWVGKRATTARAQATSLYLFAYYQGSSISGTLGGVFWVKWGWSGITCIIILLLCLSLAAAETVRKLETRNIQGMG
jgi:YNFM family putative membrane transporter